MRKFNYLRMSAAGMTGPGFPAVTMEGTDRRGHRDLRLSDD
ncbi:hypothetical protein FHS43_002986 [Streptosporangium becharense]|uniref:Uncharacterized protein n=1 Tax=Streptosporangium becharense TaxID=1816182 RepID=A0A7W9IKL8_9ACTN|nr:hypothetical protein [Streptosporangium becharense]MBB5822469.1 hypothetical protein [Streptosporangium becharense]